MSVNETESDSELLYGKKLVTCLRKRATEIRNSAKTVSYNDTAKAIFIKTGYSGSGSHLSRVSELELAVKAELRNACAIFLGIPAEQIELQPPICYRTVQRKMTAAEQELKKRRQISNDVAKVFFTKPLAAKVNHYA